MNSHNHNYNTGNTGGHNHCGYCASGGHDHAGTVFNSASTNVRVPNGNLTTPLSHSHNASVVTVNTSTDGAHNHGVNGNASNSNTVYGAFINNNTGGIQDAVGNFNTSVTASDSNNDNTGYAGQANHVHVTDHQHETNSWAAHPTQSLVPPSRTVNYLIRR